jgi:glycerol-3-phosphate acyltransferase PlsY
MALVQVLAILCAYLSGAIPCGYILIRKAYGLNILELGSGNIGSTNVGRFAGKRLALLVQILDILKGLIPVAIVLLLNQQHYFLFNEGFVCLVALSSILGHNYSIFLHFKGGKGVNTTLGATLLLAPICVICAIAVYFLVKWRFKYVSAGSLALAITLPLSGILLQVGTCLSLYLVVCCGMILIRHISNIKRLLDGIERF